MSEICKRPELKYAVTFVNARGERREVVVELGQAKTLDMLWNLADGRQAGHPDGPLANTYAAQRAAEGMPAEFTETFPQVHRVIAH